ncbi:MAG: carbamoyltransferase HypF [Clostridiales bacterium]|nr:carbamoyltransferase HypF [Clostridiales bacterium]
MAERSRIHFEIEGIVQGVGFRPFLHRLALKCNLSGWCRNTVFGVELEVEGTEEALTRFRAGLREELPPLARIDVLRETPCPAPLGESGFHIRESRREGHPDALVSPDIATCPDCLRELRDPKNRRYRYPFLNCTNCGPRFTIVRELPYDRRATSMAKFTMCPDCEAEYGDIRSRRYHAQPNCCPDCGPALTFSLPGEAPSTDDPIGQATALLQAGKIVAIKGLGGFHLACRCDLPETVAELRRRKRRDERPFALMCRDVAAAEQFCHVSPQEAARLTSPRAPIVLLRKQPDVPSGLSETAELGVMLPYTPIHHLLMEQFDTLVMTSMNVSDLPTLCELDEGSETLADGILSHDRDIVNRCDDSLLRVFRGTDLFFRRSRGYAPEPVRLPYDCTGILACGAEQKGGFALSRGQYAFLSQHIGDLKNYETYDFYRQQISRFESRFGVAVNRLVCDLHPDYLSTEYARERSCREGLPLTLVQHHHAHMAACMADNGLEGPCIGLIWDGTGYGTDGTIWGAECLTGDYTGFQRRGTIRPISLPGGDVCTTEIGRVAFSLLWDAGLLSGQEADRPLARMLEANVNCPRATSMGRLFDGVYSLLFGRETVTYDGQGAVLLEANAAEDETGAYPLSCYRMDGLTVWDTRPLVTALLEELQAGTAPERLAARFMNTLVSLAVAHCRAAREETGLERVVLSGGVFQNSYLLPRVVDALTADGFRPYYHTCVSPNDQGIALGQTLIAAKGGGISDVPCRTTETNQN